MDRLSGLDASFLKNRVGVTYTFFDKTTRDALMLALAPDHPDYGWHENKGYASPEHVSALRAWGPCDLHRRSWRLPGTAVDDALLLATLAQAEDAALEGGPSGDQAGAYVSSLAGDLLDAAAAAPTVQGG